MARDSIAAILRDSEGARWSLDEVTQGLVDLDFHRPFLPEPLVHAERLPFLAPSERVLLSQIRAHSYLRIAALCEKATLPFSMAQASWCLRRDTERFLALMGFGHQAARHIAAFERYAAAVERGLDVICEMVGGADDIGARFLAHDSLALGLLVMHVIVLPQTHYVRAARGSDAIDEHFKELLRLHWREEAQNARLHRLILTELCAQASPEDRVAAIDQYLRMLDDLSMAVTAQAHLDLAIFERVARPLDEDERQLWRHEQAASYRHVLLGQGLEHPMLREMVGEHFDRALDQLDDAARRFSVG
ncbi:MAG: hypothetical protein KC731_14960 [Myxococcales bacterium]|nr:hypothetical protein [Myxococcales bacterium]